MLAASASGAPLFEEIPSGVSGLAWVHDNAMSPQRYLPESMGPGVAFLDYDNDGWMDIYLVNSGPSDFFKPSKPISNALYKNNRDGTFTDVTEKAGVAGGVFGMGVAVGDYNNDGFPDILVTSYSRTILYRNNGDGTFTDVTAKAGLPMDGWTTSAVWFDYDNDGKLDLFICSFVDFGKSQQHLLCGDNRIGRHYYCIPRMYPGTPSFLFHNNGDGTFTEVGRGTDIEKSLGKGLGVVATDINNDGRMDLFMSNDTVQNYLFVNRGPGPGGKYRWEEIGLSAEVAFSENGAARSGMGVDAGDYDGDGLEDLFVANIDQQDFSMYRNTGKERFVDVAGKQSIAQATRLLSGWGLKYFDYDNDGFIDLILSNGHPDDMIEMYSPQVKYKEPLMLFHQENGKLRNVSAEAGPAFTRAYTARGLAIGDFNNDGRIDVLIGNNGGDVVLLKNNAGQGNHWIGLKLEGKTCNRDAVGARVTWSVNGIKKSRQKNSGGSYLSSHDPRMVLGLGTAEKFDYVEIKWPGPSKKVTRLTDLPIDKYTTVQET